MPSLDTAMSYHRLKKAPLDDREVFKNLNDLMDYCKDGARYNGQKVVVNNYLGAIEYVIRENIPIIDMKGSEPIFKSITFKDDSYPTHGMLIYENNNGGIWREDEIFNFEENKLCLISQLEIFRILDAAGNKTFKFYMERIPRHLDGLSTYKWNQNYNPYSDGGSNHINNTSSALMEQMSYYGGTGNWINTNVDEINLMPYLNDLVLLENPYITKIYVKAEDYYQCYQSRL